MQRDSTLKEILIGIFTFGVLAQLVCLLFHGSLLYHTVGLWTGIVISFGVAIHMKRSIEDGLDLTGDAGVKHMKKAYLLRTSVVCVLVAVVLYFHWGNPLTILLGITALKIAVYTQPLVHKILYKKRKGGNACGKDFDDNSK